MDCEWAVNVAATIDGWMTRPELEWLFRTARALPDGATWVELGAWKGRSFFAVAMGLQRGSRLVTVDSFTKASAELPFAPTVDWVWDHFQAVFRNVQKLRGDLLLSVTRSHTAAAGSLLADRSADVVFVDAGHQAKEVERDINAWIGKVRPGGLLCGHDYHESYPDLMDFIDWRFPSREIVPQTAIWVARQA